MNRPLVVLLSVAIVAVSLATFPLTRTDGQQLDGVGDKPFSEDSRDKRLVAVMEQVPILEPSGTSEAINDVPEITRINEGVNEGVLVDDFDDFGGVGVIQKPRWIKLVFH